MKLYSFDIFDTCLVRLCGEPDNVFFILGESILESSDDSLLRDFVRERKMAERTATKTLNKEAVTINEIYDFFDTEIFTSVDKSYIIQKEIEVEKSILVPINPIRSLIEDCRRRGKVAFISDMYLPDEMIRGILERYGLFQEGDSLYISGSSGYSKKTGNLFKYVKEKENVRSIHWHHYGDNFLSDYINPMLLGIKTTRIKHGYTCYEQQWIKDSLYVKDKWVFKTFAGLTRSVRLKNGLSNKEEFLTDVMLPAFVPFVFCLLKKANEDRIDRLYFASRDTYIHFLMAQKLLGYYPDLEIRYLYISTKVLYPIGFVEGKREEIVSLFHHLGKFKPRKILDMIGFSENEINDISKELDVDKDIEAKNTCHFVELLLGDKYKSLMISHASEKRDLLFNYLRHEEFIGKGRVALFDLGWRGTSQMMLNKVLPNEVNFYYYGVNKGILPVKQIGKYYTFFRTYDYTRFSSRFIEFYMCKMLEGSTMNYEERYDTIIPVLEKRIVNDEERNEFDKNLQLLLDGIEGFTKIPFLRRHSNNIFYNISLPSLQRLSSNPSYKTVKFLRNRMKWDRYTDQERIIERMLPHKLFDVLYNSARRTPKYSRLWMEGCIVLSLGVFGKWLLSMDLVSKIKGIGKKVL